MKMNDKHGVNHVNFWLKNYFLQTCQNLRVVKEAKMADKNIRKNYFLTYKQHVRECRILSLPLFWAEYRIISFSKQNWCKTHIILLPWQRLIAASGKI